MESIIIVGAGTFGLSTALQLARDGYKNIKCFDKFPVPSEIAAGNDSNKIFHYDYVAPLAKPNSKERLSLEALHLWKTDPVYKPYYHPVGFILAASSDAPLLHDKEYYEELQKNGLRNYRYISTPEEFREYLPILKGPLPNWRGYVLDGDNGWLHARDSLKSAYEECKRLGVEFVFGDDGEIVELLNENGKLTGIRARSGAIFSAQKYVLSSGANAVTLLNFQRQLEGKCFTLAHFKVTDEEAKAFKSLPVLFNAEKGFFFEADENNEIKICNEYPGFTHTNESGESIPLYRMEIPLESALEIRQYLKETMPQFADRPFTKTRICWCTDSPDMQLILCTHPEYINLIVASGDSGNSFKIMPIIGKYVSKVVTKGDKGLDPEDKECWKWRPETWDKRGQVRWGGRYRVADLNEIEEWVSVENPTPHKLE